MNKGVRVYSKVNLSLLYNGSSLKVDRELKGATKAWLEEDLQRVFPAMFT